MEGQFDALELRYDIMGVVLREMDGWPTHVEVQVTCLNKDFYEYSNRFTGHRDDISPLQPWWLFSMHFTFFELILHLISS